MNEEKRNWDADVEKVVQAIEGLSTCGLDESDRLAMAYFIGRLDSILVFMQAKEQGE